MKVLPLIFLILLLFSSTASAKIIGNFTTDSTGLKTVTLEESKVKDNLSEITSTSNISTPKSGSWVDEQVNKTETVLQQSVTDGIKGFFTSAADGIYNLGGSTNETTEVKNKNGYVVGTVFKIATYTNDPYASDTVKNMRQYTAYIGMFIFVIFIFLGGAKANLSCAGVSFLDRIEYTVSHSVYTVMEYKDSLIIALAGMVGVHYIFKFIILFNKAITNESMLNILQSIPLNSDNWVMYCAMAVCYGLEAVFFGLRMLLQDLIAGSDVLLGALFIIASTRLFAWNVVKYFIVITLMQFIIVLLTCFGISIIQEHTWFQPLGYLCLIIILIVVSFGMIFGFARLFSTSKMIIRRVRY